MKDLKTNYWDIAEKYEGLVCTINTVVKNNGSLVMGAGIAKDFNFTFEFLDEDWGQKTTSYHNNGFSSSVLMTKWQDNYSKFDDKWLIGLPTKYHYKDKSSIELIVKSCRQLVVVCNALGLNKILMTRPGCGCSGLNWEDVKKEINFLDDRFTVVYK